MRLCCLRCALRPALLDQKSDQEDADKRSERIASDQGSGQTFADHGSGKPQQLDHLRGVDMDPMDHNGLKSLYITSPF